MYKKYYASIILFLLLIICILVYSVGLKGNFLFDDYPNLQDIGTYGTIDSWNKVKAFIFNGFAGPTGRPISLLSFLIDTNTWPADPYSFKYTNLMIHLLNGVLLCWAIILLLENYEYKAQKSIWIALVTVGIWLLHPYFVSTTLYIIQRMAQLATIFSLIGIVGYFKARRLLHTNKYSAYFWMTISIGLGTILATYSKENGALLPLLIVTLEFCNPSKKNNLSWQWQAIFLWLPSIIIVFLLTKNITFAENPWPNRNFNMIQRLYSEMRIITEYLYNLYVPQIELKGLYQDGFIISKSLTQPITTLFSTLFLIILLLSSFILKKKYPLYALGVLFYFTAHLMESTVIGLELYFEHRNYLATIFLFLPLASGLYNLRNNVDYRLVNFTVIILLSFLSFFTYQRAKLWGDTSQLQLYWAENSPNSPRAQNAIASIFFDNGHVLEANIYLENAIKRMPDSALLNLRFLLQKIYVGIVTEEDFQRTAEKLANQSFDAQAVQALRVLVEYVTKNPAHITYIQHTFILIDTLEKNYRYNQLPVFLRLVPYLKAKLYLATKKPQQALKEYKIALVRYNDVEAGMMMVAEIGSEHYPKEALDLLDQVQLIYHKQKKSTLRRSINEYDVEIVRIKEILIDELKREK